MENKEIVLKVLSILPKTKEILNLRDITSEEKEGVANIVTSTDKKLEEYLKGTLLKMFPNSQVIAEESAEETKLEDNVELKFIVDPLDGTTNFTNGWPHAIAIGIVNNNELSGGILYDVIAGTVYSAIKDKGVYACDIDDMANLKSVVNPKHETEKIKKSVITFDTPFYDVKDFNITNEMFKKLYLDGASLKVVGPIALDVVKTALGKENRPHDYANGCFHLGVRVWDLAASTAILRELGGEIIGIDGKPLSIETLTSPTEKIAFIASGNSKMLEELYEIYQQAEKYVKEDIKADKDSDEYGELR